MCKQWQYNDVLLKDIVNRDILLFRCFLLKVKFMDVMAEASKMHAS